MARYSGWTVEQKKVSAVAMKLHFRGGGPWDGYVVEAAAPHQAVAFRITVELPEPDKRLASGMTLLAHGPDRVHHYVLEARVEEEPTGEVWYCYQHPAETAQTHTAPVTARCLHAE